MKKYSIEWKKTQGHWVQDHTSEIWGTIYKIHSIEHDTEYSRGEYLTRDEAEQDMAVSLAAAALGRKGGLVKSERKAASSRENGKKGGKHKGEQQAERYDLSKHIGLVEYDDHRSGGIAEAEMEGEPGHGVLSAWDHKGNLVIGRAMDPPEVADYIGKDAAEKLFKQPPMAKSAVGIGVRRRQLSGLDLTYIWPRMARY